MCKSIILSQRGDTYVSLCTQCKLVYVWHKTVMLTFKKKQFKNFIDYSIEIPYLDNLFLFPDGSSRFVLNTPSQEINFAFTEEEWLDFAEAMREAHYMQEVYQLIG
ncbi:hypothetical protein J5U18_07640 [Sphingobacteriaceae bacterium WQ 2009]|uniref:Uncharacterized protein n=1 Tax=Rhinopithecimicrobium faecis TaxID=2820698 RepID=A0A8T4HAH7_9SPHI|nr:hypothetical protein [Sphingobacteriaceae bacterium WQ 2009]